MADKKREGACLCGGTWWCEVKLVVLTAMHTFSDSDVDSVCTKRRL